MSYLIILTVLVLAISPLLQFIPSSRQRLIVRLREAAVKNGLYVECWSDSEFGSVNQPEYFVSRDLIFYGIRRPEGKLLNSESMLWIRDGNEWNENLESTDLVERFNKLPVSVHAVKIDSTSCGVFWTENGNEKDVQDMAELLKTFEDLSG